MTLPDYPERPDSPRRHRGEHAPGVAPGGFPEPGQAARWREAAAQVRAQLRHPERVAERAPRRP